jgi:hypothetical protein
MQRSRSFAWGGPATSISGTLTEAEEHRASARKSLHTRRASDPETLCRGVEDATSRGEAWLAGVLEAVSAR